MEADFLPTVETRLPKLRWYQPTPGRLLVLLLAVEGTLLLSEQFRWFAFNEWKGWTVLIAIATVTVTGVKTGRRENGSELFFSRTRRVPSD